MLHSCGLLWCHQSPHSMYLSNENKLLGTVSCKVINMSVGWHHNKLDENGAWVTHDVIAPSRCIYILVWCMDFFFFFFANSKTFLSVTSLLPSSSIQLNFPVNLGFLDSHPWVLISLYPDNFLSEINRNLTYVLTSQNRSRMWGFWDKDIRNNIEAIYSEENSYF